MSDRFTFASLAIKNLRRRPLRSTILVAALALMVAALVFALSFVTRVNASIQLTSERLGADLLIVPTGSRGDAEDILVENRIRSFYMDKSITDQMRKVKGIDKVSHQTYLVSLASACCSVPESMVVAFDQETDIIVKPWLKDKLGRKLQKGEAIVGNESAFNINLGLVEVETKFFGKDFKMVGVLDKTGSASTTRFSSATRTSKTSSKTARRESKPIRSR